MSYNKKMRWRKDNDRRRLLVKLTDKIASRGMTSLDLKPLIYAGDLRGAPKYPGQCIVKPNNNSGKTFHCRNAGDYEKALNRMESLQHVKYGYEKGEWAYSQVPFKVLIEKMIDPGIELGFFCFDGICRFIRLFDYREDKRYRMSHFDRDGNFIEARNLKYDYNEKTLPYFDRSIIARVESQINIDHVRTDVHISGDRVYFGEYTLYSGSGTMKWDPPEFDDLLGKWWKV